MNRDIEIYTYILDEITKIKETNEFKNIFWKSFYKRRVNNVSFKKIKILLLNAPCNGFGDVVFCMKISKYLEEWYDADVTIASTSSESFKQLGKIDNVIQIGSKSKVDQCRRFKNLHFKSNLPVQDLIFVAPVQSDYDVSLQDVKYLLPYATKFNTFFFSEYNPDETEGFDFITGVGNKDNYGLLFTNTKKIKRINKLKNPYAVVYIAESVDDSIDCFCSFIEMICAKYNNKYKNFDIVIPTSISYFFEDFEYKIVSKIKKYYPNINYVGKDKSFTLLQNKENNKVVTFRADILPVPYYDMVGLIQHSVKDILLTGDQSITDALSCCSEKNIFYQIAGWKEGFAKNLSKELPNKYLISTKTSCGTLKAIRYKSDYKQFIKKWDFRKLAKPKLDAILSAAKYKKDNKEMIKELEKIVLSSRNVQSLKSKILKYIESI